MADLALRSAAFHREVADAIIRVWRERLEAFGLPVPEATEPFVRPGDRKPACEPELLTWAPKSPDDRPALSTVADMTAAIARCYDALFITHPLPDDTNRTALWVVAVADLGGVARHVLDATRVGIPGWRITVLCPEGPLAERLRAQGSAVLTAAISPRDPLAAGVAAVRRTVRSLRPAVVHSHLAYSDFLVAGATVALSPRMTPQLVTTEHGIAGDDLVYHGTRLRSRVMELAHTARLRRFDALIAVSEATLAAVQRKWHPAPTFRTVVIPNGVDPVPAPPPPPEGRFHVVSLSRLAPEKGLGDLLEAFALVHTAHSNAHLTLAGNGPLRAELSQRVAELNLQEVVSMPGYVDAESLMRRSDVLAQLSTWENCSYSLLDSLAAHLGLITTRTGGNQLNARPPRPESTARRRRGPANTVLNRDPSHTTLIFITERFPRGPGEEFIEAELPILAKHFQKVLIVPVSEGVERSTVADLPDNVRLVDWESSLESSKLRRRIQFLSHPAETVAAIIRSRRDSTDRQLRLRSLQFDLRNRSDSRDILAALMSHIDPRDDFIIYSYWMTKPVGIGLALRHALKNASTPIVTRAHGYDLYLERDAHRFLPQRRYILKNVTAVYTVSEHGRNYLAKLYPDYAGKIHVARLGVRDAENPGNCVKEPLRLVSCSYITPVKRLRLLVDALAIAQSNGFQVNWSHIGPTESDYAHSIMNYASSRLQQGSFSFVGALTNASVRRWYDHNPCSAFINTSESEGVPVSIMEALAQGLPIIATDVGGSSEVATSTNFTLFDGLLPADPSPSEIADKVASLSTLDEEQFRRRCTSAQDYFSNDWRASVVFERFASTLTTL